MTRMTKAQQQERTEAIAQLREWLNPGDTVYTVTTHTARSGMMRCIRPIITVEGRPLDITYWVAQMGEKAHQKHGGIVMDGCGMDMGFALVYSLSRRLFPEGFGIASEKDARGAAWTGVRPFTKEAAASMLRHGYKFRGRNGDASGWDEDGGYALKHSWL